MGKLFDYDIEPEVLNDVTMYGGGNEEILNHKIKISYSPKGAKATRPGEWQVWEGTVGEFVVNNSKFERGPKDGMCILQGEAIDGHRTARAMRQLDILLMDHDTGVTFTEVCGQAEDSGIWTMVWTTHSHGKASTSIKLNIFTKKGRDNDFYVKDKSALTEEIVRQYLINKKGYLPEVLEGLTFEIEHTAQGEEVIVHHQPMDKCRSMRILKKPFVLADREGGVDGAMQEWRRVVMGAASYLNCPQYDVSCTDTSRLMYTPRVPKSAEIGHPNHRIVIINGDFLDLKDIPLGADARSIGEKFVKAGGSAGGGDFETPNLKKFMAQHSDMFEAAQWLEEIAPEDVVDQRGSGGIHFLCPNWESHTEHKDGETSFMVTNGSEEHNGFTMNCRHDGCIQASGKDRAWYLDKLCAKYGVTDAMDLVQWVANYEPPEPAEETEHTRSMDDVKDDIDAALKRDDPEELALLATTLAEKYKGLVGKRELNKLVKLRSHKKVSEIDPKEYDGPVLSSMDPDVQYEIMLKHVNRICRADQHPRVFKREEGGIVRILFHEDGIKYSYKEMDAQQWTLFLHENVQFLTSGKDGDPPKKSLPFPAMVNLISAQPDGLKAETLDRVVGVPVFAADGSLRMTEGYDRATRCYVKPIPGFEIKRIKKVPSQEDVETALYLLLEELLVGFPFTDIFGDADTQPIWDDQSNFILNFRRGRSSRINALAMLLQPFARNLIDGPCPAYVIDKPEAGSGATTLAEIVGILIDGERTRARSGNANNEEMKKQLTTALRGGSSVVFLDNVNKVIDSGDLASLLTSNKWTDRILGKSEEVSIEVRSEFIFTGNQMELSPEMVRRFCPIRINWPDVDVLKRTRKDFKHVDIHGWALKHRSELVWACHTLIQNWIAKGMPECDRTFLSYGAWMRVMGGIMEAAGIFDALMSNEQSWTEGQRADEGYASGVTSKLLQNSIVQLDTPFPTRQIVDMCYDDSKRAFDTIDVPEAVARATDVGRATMSLGRWIAKDCRGRVILYTPDPEKPDQRIKVRWADGGYQNGSHTWVIKELHS